MLAEVGPKQAQEWAARPPPWAGRPITAPPHLALHLRSSMSLLYFYMFRFPFQTELKIL